MATKINKNSKTKINYPPNELLHPNFGKPNYELIILWILNNNESCLWANLEEKIKRSTLSLYLRKLRERKYIKKKDKQYKISPEGEDRFYELSQDKKKKMNFPPDALLNRRNYDHWILWMVYNNNYCKWRDFLEEPLRINQSSLSKNMNNLIETKLIKKENKKYRITTKGWEKYTNILKQYDLDKQSILVKESKRIKEITKKTIKFFKKYEIKNDEIRFRFLNLVLKLPVAGLEHMDDEDDYNKIMLFLSINHPNQYPEYISLKSFAKKYDIEQIILDFHILHIVDKNKYPVKFFKLELDDGKTYYFQVNEKLERMLNVIVEDHVTKFTYLKNLYVETSEGAPLLTMEGIVEAILEEIVDSLFDKGLIEVLRSFLPDYITYLAYKIEKERKLVGKFDKLEGLIWREIQDYHFADITITARSGGNEFSYDFDPKKGLEQSLEGVNKVIERSPKNIDLYYFKSKVLVYFDQYSEVLTLLNRMLIDFPDHEKDLKMKKASILKRMRDLEGGLEIIDECIVKYPEDNDLLNYKAFWYQYLNNKEEALKIIQKLIEREPENGIYIDTYGEILMAFNENELAIEKFQSAIELNPDSWYIYQTNIKLGICYSALEDYELALEHLIKGRDLIDQSPSDLDTKQMWHSYADPFIEECKVLMEDF